MSALLDVKLLATPVYHPQTRNKAKGFYKTILARLRHYIAEYQKDWDAFVQPLTHAYSTQVLRSMNRTPFGLALRGHPPGPTMLKAGRALSTNGYDETAPQVLRLSLKARICTLRAKANASMTIAPQRYKREYNRRMRMATTF